MNKISQLTAEIVRIKAELVKIQSEQESLLIRSPSDGTFLLFNPEDLPDRFVRRGMPLGYVVDFSKVTARIVVPQSSIDRVRRETRMVVARLAESVDQEFPAVVKREVPAASSELPSLALSLEGGGTLALDPTEREELKAFQKLFHFEILILDSILERIGERVFVRFEHDPEPLVFRWYRGIRRTLLGRFGV